MNILQQIVTDKRAEVEQRKQLYPTKLLEQSIYYPTNCVSLKKYLQRQDKVGIIAEIKRCSPSQGKINPYICVEELSLGYMQAGASALSVVTEQKYFGGSNEDLQVARKFNFCPILRKDFIVDEYQIIEAKSIGADVILLIAQALTQEELSKLAKFAKQLGLEVLVEVHCAEELAHSCLPDVDLIGINNRNLQDFSVSVERCFQLQEKIPEDFLKVAESGLSDADTIIKLKKAGFHGFLIGGYFMQHSRPQYACAQIISEIQEKLS